MKKILTLTLIVIASILKSYGCAVVEISGPSEMYINGANNEKEKATFTAENLENHVWGTPSYTEWKFILGTKRGTSVTYDTESMSELVPGTYTLTCTSYFPGFGEQVDTKEIIISRGSKADLTPIIITDMPTTVYKPNYPFFTFRIKNEGDRKSDSFEWTLFLNEPNGNKTAVRNGSKNLWANETSNSVDVQLFQSGFQDGLYSLTVEVDSGDDVDESDESNNSITSRTYRLLSSNSIQSFNRSANQKNLIKVISNNGEILWSDNNKVLPFDYNELENGKIYIFTYDINGQLHQEKIIYR